MTTVAIIQRELVVAGRRSATYWSRFIAAGLMAALAIVYLAFSGNRTPASLSREIFEVLTWVTFAGALVSGVCLTADALSSERREGTLGLLFLTELSGLDVALGKLVASSVQGAYALLGVVPILAVPLLSGGVSGQEFGGCALALISVLLASLGIGIFASAVSRNAAQAIGLTIATLTAVCTLPLLVVLLTNRLGLHWTSWIGILSPVTAVQLTRSRTTLPVGFFWSLGANLIYGLGGLGVAAWWLTRHGRSLGVETTRWDQHRNSSIRNGNLAGLAARPQRLISGNPYQWIYTMRLASTPALRWLFNVGFTAWVFFYALCFLLPGRAAIRSFITAMFIAYGLHALFKIQLALHATGKLTEEAAGGGLELLLSTPLAPQAIMSGHSQALKRAIRRDRLRLVGVNVGLLFSVLNTNLRIGREAPVFLTIFLGGLMLLWFDPFAITRLGALWAVRTRRQSRAMWHTLLPTFLPTFIGVLTLALIFSNGLSDPDAIPLIFVAFFSALGLCAVIFGKQAAFLLARDFRSIAAGTSS